MTIYVESAFIQNFIVDYFLLHLTLKTFNFKSKKFKIILSTLLGSVGALISPIFAGIISVLFKIVLSCLMILMVFNSKNKKTFILLWTTFLSFTFLFGGICFGINCLVNSFNNNNGKFIYLPTTVILIIAILLFLGAYNIIKYIYKRKIITNFEHTVTLISDKNQISVTGFLDSGNLLTDNNTPVVLIDTITFLKLYPKEDLSNILLKKIDKINLKNAHLLKIKNINQSFSYLVVFTLPKLVLNNQKTFTGISCAISFKKFNTTCNAGCLLNPLLFKENL